MTALPSRVSFELAERAPLGVCSPGAEFGEPVWVVLVGTSPAAGAAPLQALRSSRAARPRGRARMVNLLW
ncbi:hypothetical protein D3C86_2174320 [compost metagenome]